MSDPNLFTREQAVVRKLRQSLNAMTERVEKAEENAHYSTGVADLAMNHRDFAEAQVTALTEKLALATAALEKIYAVGDGYGPNPNSRGEISGTTGEGHAECRWIAYESLAKINEKEAGE